MASAPVVMAMSQKQMGEVGLRAGREGLAKRWGSGAPCPSLLPEEEVAVVSCETTD